jgi:hypothetical protein
LVIQLDYPLGNHEWMVVGQRNHSCAQHDSVSSLRSSSEEKFRGRYDFPARGMMFSTPKFIITQPFQVFHEFQIALDL